MASIDLVQLRRRARARYELARWRRALFGVLPVVLIVAVAACFAHRPSSTLGFGVATFAAGAMMLWYGGDLQRAVLPGVAAGLVPLALALYANHFHGCGTGSCTSLCVPACALGGVVAGLVVAGVGRARGAGLGFMLSAAGLALLTGAMGCACVGYSGLLGLGLGCATGLFPGVVRRALRKNGA